MARDPSYGDPHLRAYYSHGMSFRCGYFSNGFSDKQGRTAYDKLTDESLIAKIQDIQFSHAAYDSVMWRDPTVIYCDPPYKDTSKPGTGEYQFDSNKFWQTAAQWSLNGHLVFVQEQEESIPQDWITVGFYRGRRRNETIVVHERWALPDYFEPVRLNPEDRNVWRRQEERLERKRKREQRLVEQQPVEQLEAERLEDDDDDQSADEDLYNAPGVMRGQVEHLTQQFHNLHLKLRHLDKEIKKNKKKNRKNRRKPRVDDRWKEEALFWREHCPYDVDMERCMFCLEDRVVWVLDRCGVCKTHWCASCFQAWLDSGAESVCPCCKGFIDLQC